MTGWLPPLEELTIALVVIGTLATISLPMYQGYVARTQLTEEVKGVAGRLAWDAPNRSPTRWSRFVRRTT